MCKKNYNEAYQLLQECRFYLTKYASVRRYGFALSGPSVIVEPAEPLLNKAVEVLKRMDSSFFDGVSKIVAKPSHAYGFVESGPDKDPTVININLSRIKQEAGNMDSPEAVIAAATIIAHERGHVGDFDPKEGFKRGEIPAKQLEQQTAQWIQNNMERIKDILPTGPDNL